MFAPGRWGEVITLGETADLSTFLHESGHFFLEVLADLASQPDAPAGIQADMAATLSGSAWRIWPPGTATRRPEASVPREVGQW